MSGLPSTPAAAALAVLLAIRIGGLMLVAPVFSTQAVPMRVRAALMVLFTVLLYAVARGNVASLQVTPASAISESLVGFAIGFGAAVFIGGAQLAGDVLAVQIGVSGAGALDPLSQTQSSSLGHFTQLLALTLLIAAGGHILMLQALAASLHVVHVGGMVDLRGGLAALIRLGSQLFIVGLRFAAPVIAAVLVGNVALGVLARVAPQLNVLAVAFPLQIGLGFFVLWAAMPLLGTIFSHWASTYQALLDPVFRALGAGR